MRLVKALAGSLLFCALLASPDLTDSSTAFPIWSVVFGLYWLVFLVLQTVWWRQGKSKFWRPVYAVALLAGMTVTIVPLAALLVRPIRTWFLRVVRPEDPAELSERAPGSATARTPHAVWRLVGALAGSLAVCGLVAFSGAFGAETERQWAYWSAGCLAYWAVFAVLQVVWWRQGRVKFWRPVYPGALLVGILFTVFFIPTLLIPRFRRWLGTVIRPDDPSAPPAEGDEVPLIGTG
jgi:hypothetical protein